MKIVIDEKEVDEWEEINKEVQSIDYPLNIICELYLDDEYFPYLMNEDDLGNSFECIRRGYRK